MELLTFQTERVRRRRYAEYMKNKCSTCVQTKPAFHSPFIFTAAPLLNQALCRRVSFEDLTTVITSLPLGPVVLAGASLGILGVVFENTLIVLYQNRRPVIPSQDELCQYCSGFGTIRCEICSSRGIVTIPGTKFQRKCPVCNGQKRERCKRCNGTGKTGRKKGASPPPPS